MATCGCNCKTCKLLWLKWKNSCCWMLLHQKRLWQEAFYRCHRSQGKRKAASSDGTKESFFKIEEKTTLKSMGKRENRHFPTKIWPVFFSFESAPMHASDKRLNGGTNPVPDTQSGIELNISPCSQYGNSVCGFQELCL